MKAFIKDVELFELALLSDGVRLELSFTEKLIEYPNKSSIDSDFLDNLYKLYENRGSLSKEEEDLISNLASKFI